MIIMRTTSRLSIIVSRMSIVISKQIFFLQIKEIEILTESSISRGSFLFGKLLPKIEVIHVESYLKKLIVMLKAHKLF